MKLNLGGYKPSYSQSWQETHQVYMLFPIRKGALDPKNQGPLHSGCSMEKNSTSSIRLLQHHDNTRYFLLPPIPIASSLFDLLELELRKDWNTRANNPSKQLCQLVLCLKLLAPDSGAAGTQTNVQVYKLFHKKLTQHTNTHNLAEGEYLSNVATQKRPVYMQCWFLISHKVLGAA